jgi:hypothetical protein
MANKGVSDIPLVAGNLPLGINSGLSQNRTIIVGGTGDLKNNRL